MALNSKFRSMRTYGFCFEMCVNMTVFVALFDCSVSGYVHNQKQTYVKVPVRDIAFTV